MLHHAGTQHGKPFSELSTELNLKQIIREATRITDTTQSLIEVILTSNTALIMESNVINSAISDHFLVCVILLVKTPKLPPKYITTRNYKYYDPLNIFSDFGATSDDLLSIFTGRDVNTQLETLKNALHSTLDSHAPVKTFNVRSRSNTYISNEIKEHIKFRDKLHRRFLQTRGKKDWEGYKKNLERT